MREDEIRAESERYIDAWHDTRAYTRDEGIALWTVRGAMTDIGYWAEGHDPNEANIDGWTEAEALMLYRLLAAVATSYGFCPLPHLMED